MLEIKLEGVGIWDGTYPYDPAIPFTGNELHIIKRFAGVRLGELMDALNAGDYDVVVCIAAFAIINAGKASRDRAQSLIDELLELPSGAITVTDVKVEEEPDVVVPPSVPPSGGDSSSEPAVTSPTSSPSLSPIGG
jgi:hypothetical protein